jgi:murein DD-endopeptidase MepM/ murein hydrolase activator NlpD
MPTFPLHKRPIDSYHVRPRAFGSPRDNGARKHAGCDLYAPVGTDILAVDDGEVVRAPYPFYSGTFAIEIKHPCGIARYGEFRESVGDLKAGTHVKAGQVIAKVGKLDGLNISMLHFELYSGTGTGPLTDRSHPPYIRRPDLQDPTAFLDNCTVVQPAA